MTTVTCPECNTPNQDGATFCKKCRYLLAKSEEKVRCKNGHILDPSWAGACPMCQVGSQPAQPEEGVRQKTVLEQSPQIVQPGGSGETPEGRRRTKPVSTPDMQPAVPVKPQRRKTVVASSLSEKELLQEGAKTRLVGFLVTFSRDPSGKSFEIREGRHVIGSSSEADVSVPDDSMMSSQHAILLYRRGKLMFQDNLSTNGSFVNDEEASGNIELHNYDSIAMGSTEFLIIMVTPRQEETV